MLQYVAHAALKFFPKQLEMGKEEAGQEPGASLGMPSSWRSSLEPVPEVNRVDLGLFPTQRSPAVKYLDLIPTLNYATHPTISLFRVFPSTGLRQGWNRHL